MPDHRTIDATAACRFEVDYTLTRRGTCEPAHTFLVWIIAIKGRLTAGSDTDTAITTFAAIGAFGGFCARLAIA